MKQDRSIRNSRHNDLSQSVSGHRRGNTIVLVIGILVLLVIIATAYVTRTQAGRYTATAYQQFGQRESVQQHIAEELANEVALALFARPVDPNVQPGWAGIAAGTIADSNRPRLAPRQDSVRYSRDPLFPYNYAPYHVVAWTNPPDGVTLLNLGLDPALWPKGMGNLGGGGPAINPLMQAILAGEDNPFGNPGFGDTRWLRDNEPLRWDTWDAFNGTVGQDGIPDAYSHWRHLTNIARPDNAWRIVFDISDVGDSDNNGFGRLITDLNIPVEQWLAAPHSYRNVNSGNSYVPASNDFWAQWNNWFSMAGYELAFTNAGASGINTIPPNLYFLSDLDGDGIRHNFVFGGVAQDLPESEFITGTARNIVSRVLTDTDGDGYTDAFWFLAPSSVNSGIRTIMAVSNIDNSAMVNANVATRQARNDFEWGTTPMKTAGHHPADLALVGNGMQYSDVNLGNGNWNTGTFDNWGHWNTNPAALYDAPATWVRHVREVGLYDFNTAALTSTPNVATRMDYWRNAGSRGLAASGQTRYNPFGLSDELELRMFHGNNFPWIVSRFEWTTERPVSSGYPDTLLRSTTNREEASEYIDQLMNRESVRDLRRRLTLYSATRNDLMPPSIWAFDPLRQPFAGLGGNEDLNVDGVFDVLDTNLFNTGMRKFDLRLGEIAQVMGRFYDNNADSIINEYGYWNIDYTTNINEYNYRFGVALRDHLRQSLMDTQINLPPGDPGTYYGVSANGEEKTNRLAAAYAANITQRRDANWVSPVAEAVPVAPSATNTNPTERFIGLEVQPFIVEAFIGHVYRAQTVPQFDLDGDPYTDFGDYLLLDSPGPDPARRSTIVVVQIANPFNVPIDLRDYRISVFGQTLHLDPIDPANPNQPKLRDDVTGLYTEAPYILEPGTEEKPTTAIYYSIDPTLIGSVVTDLKWRNFLDLEIGDHTNNTIIATTQTTPWSQDRDLYDTSAPNVQAIELQRLDPNGTAWVVIDRMDYDPDGTPSFGNAVREMGYPDNRPCPEPIPLNWYDVPPTGAPWEHDTCSTIPDVKLGPAALGYNQWVQWVRATRAWGADVNGDGRYDPNERSPRYVFGDRAVITPGGPLVGDFPAVDGTTRIRGGNRYKFDRNADADPASVPVVNLPWFTRQYVLPIVATGGSGLTYVTAVDPDVYVTDPTNVDYRFPRKPTFFDMNRLNEPIPPCGNPNSDPNYPLGRSYPDKGWYSQGNSPDTDPSPAAIRLWFPMQMIQKDRDFEQVGELLNVWLYGHEVDVSGVPPALVTYNSTITTFSEFMSQDAASGLDYIDLVGDGARVNRLRTEPITIGGDELGALVGVASSAVTDPRHGVPALPAGVRLLDAFVCDGYGIDPVSDLNRDGVIDGTDTTLRNNMIFSNAKNFDGTGTPGMININTTSPEAASANPHWNRLVHETGVEAPQPPICPSSLATLFNYAGQPLVTTGGDPNALLPRTMIPEAILQYREGFNGGYPYGGAVPYATIFEQSGIFRGPNYENRREMFTRSSPNDQTRWVRGERGMASIGEVMMLREIGQAPTSGPGIPGFTSRPTSSSQFDFIYNQYWRYDLNITPDVTNALDTLAKPIWSVYPNISPSVPYQSSMRISTDRSDLYDPFNSIIGTDLSNTTVVGRPDTTAGDVEEANALFAGASNIITTRSDTFTVYFRIRSFRQNTSVNPPVWDATNPEYIVDDSRYVMLVDRSGVNKPGDKPRILYLEKLPN